MSRNCGCALCPATADVADAADAVGSTVEHPAVQRSTDVSPPLMLMLMTPVQRSTDVSPPLMSVQHAQAGMSVAIGSESPPLLEVVAVAVGAVVAVHSESRPWCSAAACVWTCVVVFLGLASKVVFFFVGVVFLLLYTRCVFAFRRGRRLKKVCTHARTYAHTHIS